MESLARAPGPLTNKGAMGKNWRIWKDEFVTFLKASGVDKKEEEQKANILKNLIGKVGTEALQNIKFDNECDKENYELLLMKFDDYFDPPKREIEERYQFFTYSKKEKESIEAFIANLTEKAKTCNFGDLTDSLIRDKIILDIKDKHLRQMMFDEKDLDLKKLAVIYKSFQINADKMKEMSKKISDNVKIKKDANSTPMNNFSAVKICWRCGTSHAIKNCPAWNHVCDNCKEKGHFFHRCKEAKKKPVNVNFNANLNKNVSKNPFSQIDKKINN